MWFSGDQGACYAPPEGGNIIRMVHFGYHQDQVVQGPAHLYRKPLDLVHSCVHPTRDIVASPYNDVGFQDATKIFDEVRLRHVLGSWEVGR